MHKRKKVAICIRLDEKILGWFKRTKKQGYQSLIHDVLEDYVDTQTQRLVWSSGRAQELFRQYYAQCFWHYDPKLEITPENISLVVEGLKKYGGRQGLVLAEELCH